MTNRIYGILTSALEVLNPKRYSDSTASAKQKKLLTRLATTSDYRAELFVDFIIKILSCSPRWPMIIRTFDPNNSYDIPIISEDNALANTLDFNPLQRLCDWADNVPAFTNFPTSDNDPLLDRITNKLLGVLLDE